MTTKEGDMYDDDEETTTDDDDNASQTTEDDPQIPEQHIPIPAPAPAPVPLALPPSKPPQVQPATNGTPQVIHNTATRQRPHYTLLHTMTGHIMSISAVKFSPDGTLLASCGMLCSSDSRE